MIATITAKDGTIFDMEFESIDRPTSSFQYVQVYTPHRLAKSIIVNILGSIAPNPIPTRLPETPNSSTRPMVEKLIAASPFSLSFDIDGATIMLHDTYVTTEDEFHPVLYAARSSIVGP